MLCNQNKPFHSSMSTRNREVSSTGKFETWARILGKRLAVARLLPSFATIPEKALKDIIFVTNL